MRARAGRCWRIRGHRREAASGSRRWQVLTWGTALALLAWVQAPAIWASFQQTLQPDHLSDDARQQIFPFFRYLDPNLFPTDYIADYYLDCYPLGYWGLYAGTAKLGVDPALVGRVLLHLLWLSTTILVAAVAHRLAGKLATFCVLALSLGTDAYSLLDIHDALHFVPPLLVPRARTARPHPRLHPRSLLELRVRPGA